MVTATRFRSVVATLVLLAGAAGRAGADPVIYTFEAPNFIVGQTTPLANRAPNGGVPTFRTSFTATPTAGGFTVVPGGPNPLFSGQSLFDPTTPVDLLTLTFNQPVDQLVVTFATMAPNATFTIATPSGSVTTPSLNVGPGFPGGIAIFTGTTPFLSAQLSARTATGAATLIAIDNLRLNVIPEPSTLALCGPAALVGVLLGWRRRRRQAA